jgi:hypothetical protein
MKITMTEDSLFMPLEKQSTNFNTHKTAKNMNRVQAILTLDMDNIPANFQEILKHEQEVVAQWKEEGVLEHLYLRQTKNGAILIFKGINEQQAQELMKTLPFYQLKKSVEYLNLILQF